MTMVVLGLCVVMMLCGIELIGYAADAYDGASKVSVKSGNLNPLTVDTAQAQASGCATGNRWGSSDIDSVVKAKGYIYYYSPSKQVYKKYEFNTKDEITKPGELKTLIKRKGTELDSKYDDAYAISIFSTFNLTCKKCGAEVTRSRSASE